MDRLVAVCQTKADQQRWVDLLSQTSARSASQPPTLPSKNPNNSVLSSKVITARSSYQSGGNKAAPVNVSGVNLRSFSQAGVGDVGSSLQQPPLPPHKSQQHQPPPLPPPIVPIVPPAAKTHVSDCGSCVRRVQADDYDYVDCCYLKSALVQCSEQHSYYVVNKNSHVDSARKAIDVKCVRSRVNDGEFNHSICTVMEICIDCDLPLYTKNNFDILVASSDVLPIFKGIFCRCKQSSGTFDRYVYTKNRVKIKNILDPSEELMIHASSAQNKHGDEYPYCYDRRKEPYALMSRRIKRMYREKVITRSLLRALSGDRYDLASAAGVAMRRPKKQKACTAEDSSDELHIVIAGCDNEVNMGNAKDAELDTCVILHTNRLTYIQEKSKLDTLCPENTLLPFKRKFIQPEMRLPIPTRKFPQLEAERNRQDNGISNLHKWNCSPYSEREFSRFLDANHNSCSSSSRSNPYGFIHYISSDNTDGAESPLNKRHTYTKDASVEDVNEHKHLADMKQLSLDPRMEQYAPPSVFVTLPTTELNSSENELVESSCEKKLNSKNSSTKLEHFSGSIVLVKNVSSSSPEEIPCCSISHDNIGMEDLCQSSQDDCTTCSPPNICNKTIYGTTSSEEIVADLSPLTDVKQKLKSLSFLKSPPNLKFYFSSCSADDPEEDQSDFYASCREFYSPFVSSLSRSEPNIYYSAVPSAMVVPQFTSHYVQVVCSLAPYLLEEQRCRCETFSLRSSDSGMVDMHDGRHLDDCPFKGDVMISGSRTEKANYRFGSNTHHSNYSQRFTEMQCDNLLKSNFAHSVLNSDELIQKNYEICNFVPAVVSSTNFNLCNDKIVSFDPVLNEEAPNGNHNNVLLVAKPNKTKCIIDSVEQTCNGPISGSNHHNHYDLCEVENSDEPLYRSVLYAHWWMKAIIASENIKCDKKKTTLNATSGCGESSHKNKINKASHHAYNPDYQVKEYINESACNNDYESCYYEEACNYTAEKSSTTSVSDDDGSVPLSHKESSLGNHLMTTRLYIDLVSDTRDSGGKLIDYSAEPLPELRYLSFNHSFDPCFDAGVSCRNSSDSPVVTFLVKNNCNDQLSSECVRVSEADYTIVIDAGETLV